MESMCSYNLLDQNMKRHGQWSHTHTPLRYHVFQLTVCEPEQQKRK